MEKDPKLIISQKDFQKISSLLTSATAKIAELLEEELDRALIVPADKLPNDVVSMGSTAKFIDLDTNKELVITLVYPHEANIEKNKVSILTPVGSALIGLRVGQTISWPMPSGEEKKLKVVELFNQE